MSIKQNYIQNQDDESEEEVIQMVLSGSRIIDFYRNGRWIYQIFLCDLRTGTQALDWCRQLSQKSWMSPRLLSHFCTLALGALNAQ